VDTPVSLWLLHILMGMTPDVTNRSTAIASRVMKPNIQNREI
jgi:hypothetical protein